MPHPRRFWPLFLLPLALAGCSDSPYDGGNMAEPRPVMTVFKEAAAELLKARAYGDIRDAARRRDQGAIKRGIEDYDRAAQAGKLPQEAAEVLVQEAEILLERAGDYSGRVLPDEDRSLLVLQADSKYRLALQLYPRLADESEDRRVLNSIGYHLADKGTTQEDFRMAEKLTRRALQVWDVQLRQPAPDNTDDQVRLRLRRAQEALDSLAWALFRQGRYREAKPLAEEVLRTVRQTGDGFSVDPALPFHLAEIYRALGEHEAARREYEVALRVAPAPDIEAKIKRSLDALNSATTKQQPVKTPQPPNRASVGTRP